MSNKSKMIKDLLETKSGQMIISIILGLGLAAVFRQVCKGPDCIVIQSPDVKELEKYYYKLNEECYKYTPYPSACDVKRST
jgi:hypothetical protein